MAFSTIERGTSNALDYKIYFVDASGQPISPFHDIPLFASEDKKLLNMVVEIPRWTNAKMEITKEERLNPIKQDVKNGLPRFVKNVFPHHGYIWNYGAFPQTWEDPDHWDSHTQAKGDNDPLDVCEIGFKVHPRGSVVQVKVLGVMALVDEGETDWKVFVIDSSDPLASSLNDIDDIETHMPGYLKATFEWLRDYKVPDGKPTNQFGFEGEPQPKAFAEAIVDQTHEQWKQLISGQRAAGAISLQNTAVSDSASLLTADAAREIISETPPFSAGQPQPVQVDKWHYA